MRFGHTKQNVKFGLFFSSPNDLSWNICSLYNQALFSELRNLANKFQSSQKKLKKYRGKSSKETGLGALKYESEPEESVDKEEEPKLILRPTKEYQFS